MENLITALGGPGDYLVARFFFIVLVGLVLTPILSWLVLRRYRASAHKFMRRRAAADQKNVHD